MDDLYDNLENYNDVNIVDELKCENRELKLKLEEISKSMAQLQKDFDKVNFEYKKLEINYSSLLKTARAEIERKTETIKNLNLEKDMIVINALKETGKNVLKVKKGNFNNRNGKKNNNTTDPDVNKEKPNNKATPESKHHKNNGVDSSYAPSVDSIPSISTGYKSTSSEEKATKPVESCEKPKNKENISKDNHKDETLQRCKHIINRRKSVPALSIQEAKFSSDEDIEAKNAATRKSPLRSDFKHNAWHDPKDYRIEPHESNESSKEHSRLRTSRHSNYEKFRNVGRHETFQRHRGQYSLERDRHRYINEHAEDYNVRGDYGKQRVSRTNSPATDKYNRSKSRDRRFNYDRENYREYDRHSNRNYDHTVVKHRTRNEFDEPCSKRQKIDLHSKGAAETNSYMNNKEREITERIHVSKSQFKQNSSCQSPDQVNVDFQHYVKEVISTAESKLEDPRISSKKYILKTSNDGTILSTVVGRNIEMQCVDKSLWNFEKSDVPTALSQPISDRENDDLLKEIYMDVDNSQLHHSLASGEIHDLNDDVATNYSKEIHKDHDNIREGKSNTNDSEIRNLNVCKEKVIDTNTFEKSLKTNFKIPKIKTPDKMDKDKDLAHREHCDISKKSNTNLDTNVENRQHIHIEYMSDKQINKKNKSKNDIKNNSESDKDILDNRTLIQEPYDISKKSCTNLDTHVENHQHIQNNDQITDKQNNKKNKSKNDIKNNSESDKAIIDKRTQDPCDISKTSDTNLDTHVENHQHIQNIEQISDKQNNKKNKSKHDIKDNSESDKAIIDKRTQEIIRTIEGDLELSDDEASDIVEFHNDTDKKSNYSLHEPIIILNIDKDSNSSIRKENKHDVSSFKSEPTSTKKSDKVKSLTSSKDSFNESKKRKSKKRTFEQKETHSVTSHQQNEKSHNTKKIKEKDSKQTVSKQTKNKFSDLFGDSSSLITPDDLGLNNIQVQSVDKYSSIFDNTQDAVDLSVEDIAKTLTRVNKVNTFDTVLDELHDEKVENTMTNNFGVNVTVVNENDENRTEDKPSVLNNVYENTKSETLTDASNIVKTVIISSGIQPNCLAESSPLENIPQIDAPSLKAVANDASLKKCPLNSIKALATSTPQKYIEHVDVSAALRDSLGTNTNAPTEDSASSNMSNSSLNNSDALQKEADIPDVRIFVRRRRKLVRKATQ
ncbi:putative uncharacterized protein DDB_G0282133 isoform X2 [Nymphalis io]|uniref:putative uncharacterized protein DDB_G0282133 isoform X2 n=1 Tax=Inachis io TaxID=171585 RepID=UPI002169B664|nr:putative uncharacterized protein DDB_G0282133 isoform X2 [Nymphalis io]